MTAADYSRALICAALRGEKPPEKPDSLTFQEVLTFAHRHKLENICLAAIRKLETQPDAAVMREWSGFCNANLAQTIVQEQEKQRLVRAFNEAQIPFLPMKGWYLRGMYPQPEHRFMSDLDVLIHREDRYRAAQVMRGLGYSGGPGDYGSDDSYHREPFLHVELHLDLINLVLEDWNAYYQDIWERAVPAGESEYALSWSEYYIYMVVNFAKDYEGKGTGVRSVLDFYLFLEKHGGELDLAHVDRELARLGIRELAEAAVELAYEWFGQSGTGGRHAELAAKLERDGIFGSLRQNIGNRFAKMTEKSRSLRGKKISFLLQRAFPGRKLMRYKFPVLEKAPFLLPLFWVIRWCRHSKRIRQEIETLREIR